MSWTIEFPPGFNPVYASTLGDDDETWYKLYSRLRNAVIALSTKGIILLCATSDKGRNETSRNAPVYPGAFGFRNQDILTIGAASSTFGPPYTPVHFIFPGENVPLERDLGGETSGSSVATATASGMAASILALVDMVCREDEKCEQNKWDERVVPRDKITTAMIAKAFESLGGSPTVVLDVIRLKEIYKMLYNSETEEGKLPCGGLAIIKTLLRDLHLVYHPLLAY